jgi:hypothetical protein
MEFNSAPAINCNAYRADGAVAERTAEDGELDHCRISSAACVGGDISAIKDLE